MEKVFAEQELLICCARTPLDDATQEEVRNVLRKDLDWNYILTIAGRNGLIPLLYSGLQSTCPEHVPPLYLEQLKSAFQANRMRNMYMTGQLIKLLHLFESNGITAIPYKGPALAEAAYGNIALRSFSDLDILIRRNDILRAHDLMMSWGYQPFHGVSSSQLSTYAETYSDLSFSGDNGRVPIDLQWEIAADHFVFPLDPLSLWVDAAKSSRFELFCPPIEKMLLILCVHGTKDYWERLVWVSDVAGLLSRRRDLNWESLMDLASGLRAQRMLFLGLFLAGNILNVGLPDHVRHAIEADKVVKETAQKISRRLFSTTHQSLSVLESCRFYLRLKDHFVDKALFCIRLATRPPTDQWTCLQPTHTNNRFYNVLRHMQLALSYLVQPARSTPKS